MKRYVDVRNLASNIPIASFPKDYIPHFILLGYDEHVSHGRDLLVPLDLHEVELYGFPLAIVARERYDIVFLLYDDIMRKVVFVYKHLSEVIEVCQLFWRHNWFDGIILRDEVI